MSSRLQQGLPTFWTSGTTKLIILNQWWDSIFFTTGSVGVAWWAWQGKETVKSPVIGGICRFSELRDASNPQWKTALRDPKILHSLTVDVGLIVLFVLQHSLMASDRVKHWTCNCFGVLQRTVYVFCTDLSLQLLMRYWQPVQDGPMLWSTNTEPWITWVPLICFILHFISWLIIFSIILIFDYAELMGVKQVYYYCLGMGDPLAVKSSRALRLYSHLRHPLYVEFLLILWAVPCLSIDRLLLASLFTVYLTCAHSLDEQDYLYLRAQLDKKFQIFSREEAQEVG
uniref:Nurim n=1 Tax=Naja naja TaxID=35670 RepID=A0A8C6VCK2_NAJNA